MKIVIKNVLWVLCFVAYQYYCLANNSFTIGVLTTNNDSQINIPLKSIISKQNFFVQKAHYANISATVSKYDSFEASKVLCNMMNISEGLTAVFGVDAPTSAILRSTCVQFEIPYLITSWRPSKKNQNVEYNKEYSTVLNFFPEANLFAEGLRDVVKGLEWNNFVIIYETEEGLIRMQEILKMQTVQGTGNRKRNILVKQLGPGPDHRPLLKEIGDMAERNIILDCKTEDIIPILKQGVELKVLDLLSKVFLTSLDAHTLDYSQLKSSANITAIRIFNSKSETFNKTLRQWDLIKFGDREGPLKKNDITTETVLFHDALLLLTETINDLKSTNSLQTQPIDCMFSEGGKNAYGLTVAYFMKIKSPPSDLLSKPLLFDKETGNRVDFNIHVLNVKDDTEIAIWHASNRTLRLTRNATQTTDAMIGYGKNITFIVASSLLEPYLMMKKEEGEPLEEDDRYEGYSMDLIKAIAKIKQFKFRFQVGDYGPSKWDPKKKKWTGLIGQILDRRAHLAISDLTITHQRGEVVDFSIPYMSLGISILYKKPAKGEVNMFAFLEPFSIQVWLYTATLYLIVSIILYFIARMTPGDWENPHPCDQHPEELENMWNLKNCMWLTLGSIMTQGSDILTKGISSRTAVAMWWFFSLIMANSYMANLTAFLTINRMGPTIDSAEALAKQSRIKYGTVDGGATQAFFRDSNYSTYKRMWEAMESSIPNVFEKSNPAGVNRVRSDPRHLYAFLMESTQIEYEIQTKCDLKKVGDWLDRKNYGIAMPINADYRNAINMAILKLSEEGTLDELKQRWWIEKRKDPPCPKADDNGAENKGLNLANVGGIFLVLGFGIAIAVILGLTEFLWNIRNVCVEEHLTYWEALKIEVKFACSIWITKKKTKPVASESSSAGSNKDVKTDSKSLVHSIMHSAGSFMNLDK